MQYNDLRAFSNACSTILEGIGAIVKLM